MDEKIIATIGSREITVDDFEYALMSSPKESAQFFNTDQGKKALLDQMVKQELLYLNAIEDGLDKEEEYIKELEILTAVKLKEYAIRKLFKEISVSKEDAEEFYNTYKENFVKKESARAKHILVDNEEKANEILKEIKEGKSFEELAKEYSKCPSKDNGGDLGYFERGRMVPEFEEVAFKTNVGEISEVVQTQFGYHIIKVEDKKEASKVPFEQVEAKIKEHLLAMKRDEKLNEFTEKSKEKYAVNVNEDLIK